jgi:hypothetical protein
MQIFIINARLEHFGQHREHVEAESKEQAEQIYRERMRTWNILSFRAETLEENRSRKDESIRMQAIADEMEAKEARKRNKSED